MASADLKNRLERRDDDAPKKLPAAEREERRQALATRLGRGLLIEGRSEPANALVDAAAQMYEDDCLRSMPWGVCTHRLAEVSGERRVEYLAPDRQGYLRVCERTSLGSADASDLLAVMQCLLRRGMAADIAGCVSFDV